ncbi:MAG: hypothetical protein K8R02_02925 [Anaerohalosphaeraceae bacterium]|nr:hypothetical protein [Anaerohalosphaeraceae bacterium]
MAEPWYNRCGDCIVYKTVDVAVVSNRIDEVLTIYESLKTGDSIGFKIKGVNGIVSKFGYDGLMIKSKQKGIIVQSISVTALLLAAYETGPMNIKRRQAYAGVLSSPQRPVLEIPIDSLQACT